jgi:hypothetical protein
VKRNSCRLFQHQCGRAQPDNLTIPEHDHIDTERGFGLSMSGALQQRVVRRCCPRWRSCHPCRSECDRVGDDPATPQTPARPRARARAAPRQPLSIPGFRSCDAAPARCCPWRPHRRSRPARRYQSRDRRRYVPSTEPTVLARLESRPHSDPWFAFEPTSSSSPSTVGWLNSPASWRSHCRRPSESR